MKMRSSRVGLLASLAASATAFPAAIMEKFARDPSEMHRAIESLQERASSPVTPDSATYVFEPIPMFNAAAQFINVGPGSGNEWQAPTKSDLRGPCPGLNAFANHGFLPRNGYATITEFINACQTVVGMGSNLATFLAVLGATVDGSGTAWSIGGTPTTAIAGPLPAGNGISASHNKYESDASPTRPDLYEYGNDYKVRLQQFEQLIKASPGNNVTMDTLAAFRSQRFDTQVANNPYFFNGPFTGVLVQPAAYTFIYRFMANHSSTAPYGYLDYSVLESWFGVTNKGGSYSVKQGYERIPENWYRRAIEYPYENQYFLADVANIASIYPKFLDIGGNTGKVNTFTGLNVTSLTSGIYNAQTLAQGDNFACLAYQFSAQAKPDVADPGFTAIDNAIASLIGNLNCAQLEKIDTAQLEQFPGYRKSQNTAGY